MSKVKLVLFLFALALNTGALAKSSKGRPSWFIKKEESLNKKRSNDTYIFKVVNSEGPSLQNLKDGISNVLSTEIGREYKIEGKIITKILNDQVRTELSEETINSIYKSDVRTEVFYAKLVDDYWEYQEGGYKYYALFAVSSNDKKPIFDEFSASTEYGIAPVFMSIIPGLGQMYKGSTIKGICMLGGVAVSGLGALFCENERSDYKNKMKEQPQFAKNYNTKANNYETGRNVCLGAAAAIWVYNIIDAAAAKGAKRIIVKPTTDSHLSIHPVATPQSVGVSLSYNF